MPPVSLTASAAAVAAAAALLYAASLRTTSIAEDIDGTAIAKAVRLEVKAEVDAMVASKSTRPGLAVVLVGAQKDSQMYVRMKKRAAAECGFHTVDVVLSASATQAEIVAAVLKLNADRSVHGVLVQLPLPAHVDESCVLSAIAVEKDCDGFAAVNIGNLWLKGGPAPQAVACTPAGIIELLARSNVSIKGKRCVVVGRSNIVGMPAAALLQQLDATVTVLHSASREIEKTIGEADILVACVGQPELIKGSWLKRGCVVIDVGINAVDDASSKKGYRLVGDVEYESARRVASKITPVPGGVGPMTIAMLLRNTLRLAQRAPAAVEARIVTAPLRSPRLSPVPKDIFISQACAPLPMEAVAATAGVLTEELVMWGRHKAKVDASAVRERLAKSDEGSLVVVCGINPTPLGEGKSTTTVGVCQALGNELRQRVVTTIRQPSQGPTFGIKGGAAGGGYSQVVPMEEFNLHMTGDIHAVTAANNLAAAALDARIFHEATQSDTALFNRLCPLKDGKRSLAPSQRARLERLGVTDPCKLEDGELLTPEERLKFARLDVDKSTITWCRAVDTCDRFLRTVEVGRAKTEAGHERVAKFEITVASEIMAVLALATDAKDARARLGAMAVARSRADGIHEGCFVTCDDLGVGGALAVLMKDALDPTLMQTLEGTPVLVHAGPFANIAHGNSSVIADKLALKLVGKDGFCVTEAGFGADIGGEKCFDIKCRGTGLEPRCVVLVATVRALKLHGGAPPVVAGKPTPAEYSSEDLVTLKRGCANLRHHVQCVSQKFGIRCVVAVNKFVGDTDAELELVKAEAMAEGAFRAVTADHWARGGEGAVDLAKGVMAACADARQHATSFKHLYALDVSVKEKVFAVCSEIYKAGNVVYTELAEQQIAEYERLGLGQLPVCIAKTQYSLSTDPKLKGVPTGHTVTVREVRASIGAKFLYMLCGDIMTIPGLPTRPGFVDIDLDTESGRIIGLF